MSGARPLPYGKMPDVLAAAAAVVVAPIVASIAAAVVAAASAFAEAVAAAAEQNQQDDDPDAAVATENTVVTHKRILLDLEFTIVYGGSAEVVTEFLRFFGYAGNVDIISENNDMVIFLENIVSARKRLN